jgi:MraZ protein
MFIGEYRYTVDEKGRLSVPALYRNSFRRGGVITRGIERCLFLYPQKEWEKLAEKLAALPLVRRRTRSFTRLLLAGAFVVRLDRQGRVIVPEILRRYAALRHAVVIAGLNTRFEIWDADAWEREKRRAERDAPRLAEALADLEL